MPSKTLLTLILLSSNDSIIITCLGRHSKSIDGLFPQKNIPAKPNMTDSCPVAMV